ncbi:hypothetical protein HK405_003445, partial [Cladochytrium tenue]
ISPERSQSHRLVWFQLRVRTATGTVSTTTQRRSAHLPPGCTLEALGFLLCTRFGLPASFAAELRFIIVHSNGDEEPIGSDEDLAYFVDALPTASLAVVVRAGPAGGEYMRRVSSRWDGETSSARGMPARASMMATPAERRAIGYALSDEEHTYLMAPPAERRAVGYWPSEVERTYGAYGENVHWRVGHDSRDMMNVAPDRLRRDMAMNDHNAVQRGENSYSGWSELAAMLQGVSLSGEVQPKSGEWIDADTIDGGDTAIVKIVRTG